MSTHLVSTKARTLRHLLRVAIGQQEIGNRIREARERADLTQAEVEVSSKRLRRIAEATNQPMSFFVQEPEEQARDVDVVDRLGRIEQEQRTQLELLRELVARLRPAEEEPPR